MRNYHLVLSDGTERNIKCDGVQFIGPILHFFNQGGETVVAYAEGEWKYVELERLDDKD